MDVTSLPLLFTPVLLNILKRIIIPGFREYGREFTGFLFQVPENPNAHSGIPAWDSALCSLLCQFPVTLMSWQGSHFQGN